MTKRESIINEIKAALETILISNGYVTDAGQSVYIDRSAFDENETKPFININEGEDSIIESNGRQTQGNKIKLSLPVSIESTNSCDPLIPATTGHDLIGDIKKCLFKQSWSVNILEIQYQSSSIAQHENGSGFVMVSVNADIIYIETLGNPEE